MTPAELAAELGVDPKIVRRWLRQNWPRGTRVGRWNVTTEQASLARTRFPENGRPRPPVVRMPAPAIDAESLADWSPWRPLKEAASDAPRLPGVYMARDGEHGPLVYVGMAGERRGQGIRGRLGIYFSGKGLVSGLGEAAFDRALADPAFLQDRLDTLRVGRPERAKVWGKLAIERADLWIRWATTRDRRTAAVLELQVIRALHAEDLWNRLR